MMTKQCQRMVARHPCGPGECEMSWPCWLPEPAERKDSVAPVDEDKVRAMRNLFNQTNFGQGPLLRNQSLRREYTPKQLGAIQTDIKKKLKNTAS